MMAAMAKSAQRCTPIPPITVMQYQPKVSKISGPFSATSLAMMQPIANGATDISQWVTFMITALNP